MLKILALALTALIGAGRTVSQHADGPTASRGAAICPADHADLRARVVRLIQSPGAQPYRQRDGWAHVNAANVQALTDETHAGVCEWLRTNVTFTTRDRITSYYVADGFYFVATERLRLQPAGTMTLGAWQPVIVIRNDLTFIGSYAS